MERNAEDMEDFEESCNRQGLDWREELRDEQLEEELNQIR